ncbi:MAG: sulfatase-like hydrolase/transferase [Planctomycetota bacterium]
MADDMGYECVGVNGGETYQTPHLDALAKAGVRFTRGHSQPICTPTRVQIMSGLYNSRNYTVFGELKPGTMTFANMLQEAGYATCIVGKWQLRGGFEGPNKFGFDEYCLWQLTRRPNRFPNPGLEINGVEKDFKNGEYGPDLVTDYANGFIDRQAKAGKPFLLYYPMMLPHWPFEPTPDSEEWDPTFRRGDAKEINKPPMRSQKYFIDMVAYTDKMVGKIIQQLEDSGVRGNTLLIFTGDNGTYVGITSILNGKPYRGGKGKATLNGTHVPLIVDWPGKAKSGSVVDDLVDVSDMLPTMLDAAGVAMPDGFEPDGRSFLPQVLGEAGNPRDWVYCWYNRSGKGNAKEFAMTKRYKLYGDGKLFDLDADFEEKSPILKADRTAKQADVVTMLSGVINERTRKQ